MKSRLVLAFCLGLFAGSSFASEDPMAAKAKLAVEGGQAQLTVTSINHESREVVLKNEAGDEQSFVIGKEARNLDQVNAGDIVTIKAAQAVALALYPAGDAMKGRVEKTSVSRSELGQKPHMSISREVELTGKVAKLDKQTRMAVIQGKNADIELEVAADVDLDKINVGDVVQATYLEMISITVNAPAK